MIHPNPIVFFGKSAKTRKPIGLKFDIASQTSFLHLPYKMSGLGQVRSWKYDVLHDVMFGRNRPISLSIVSGRVLLLSGMCFCIACSINGVYGYREAIYSCIG